MSNQRQYEKVSGGSNNPRWEPNKSTTVVYSDQNPAKLEGYFLKSTERHSNENGDFMVHEIQTLNPDGSLGEVMDVSLGVGLDNTLKNVDLGSFVCVEYKGKKKSKTPGRTFNDTDVHRDKGAIPYNQLAGKASSAPAAESTTGSAPASSPASNAAKSNPFPEDDELPF